MSDVNGVALAVLIALFALVTGMGFWADAVAPADKHGVSRRVGARRTVLRHLGHVVPARR